jgi:predicted dithiol-disulfide oxidoreductase (DUF899 family)
MSTATPAARRALLEEEKRLTRLHDEVAAKRRALPPVRVDEPYAFDTPRGRETLADVFEGRGQLLVYHFMYSDDMADPCKSCSFWADGFDHIAPHLAARDVTFTAISRAPLATLQACSARFGWSFPWVSSAPSQFNRDFGVTFDGSEEQPAYNFGTIAHRAGEAPGASAFLRGDDGAVYHTYSTYARGLDALNPAYAWLDLAPRGRDEERLAWSMEWLRLRDRYDDD